MDCGTKYSLQEYINEIDEKMWEEISSHPCDRV
jgi:hypothetical protein